MHRAALLLVCCACLGAQPAAIEGVVVNQANGQPMAGVHVRFLSIASSADGQPYGAISDRAGHFSIASLPAGAYIADALRRGFFFVSPKGETPMRRVTLKAGQQLADFKIEMVQGATISGRVVDDNGDPVQTNVHAEAEAERVMMNAGSYYCSTDERGEFHLSIAPGKYYIVASPNNRGMFINQSVEIRTDGSIDAAYGETYYPGSPAKAKAVQVEAVPGAELTGIDIHLVRQLRGFAIAGTVTGAPEGSFGGMVMLQQGDDSRRMNAMSGSGTTPDGHFLFSNLQPGSYRLTALHFTDKNRLYSQPVDVRLESADVSNVNLALGPGGEVVGKLEMTGSPGAEKLSVGLEITSPGFGASAPSAEVDQSGAFRITDIAPGRYRVNVAPLPENAYLKSIRLDGAEAPDGEVDLSHAAPGASLKIVVSRNGGQISGKLLDKDGQPLGALRVFVLLVPAGLDTKEIDLQRSLKSFDDGTYRLQGIRPGKYRLLTFDPDQFTANGEFLETVEKLPAGAEEIEIKEGDRKVMDLKPIVKEDGDAKPAH
jgi:hypothetical protein